YLSSCSLNFSLDVVVLRGHPSSLEAERPPTSSILVDWNVGRLCPLGLYLAVRSTLEPKPFRLLLMRRSAGSVQSANRDRFSQARYCFNPTILRSPVSSCFQEAWRLCSRDLRANAQL